MAFFGEEKGLLGSTYYAAHPLVPLEKTVADVNIEHLGRTDSTERNKAGTASLTGYDFSDVPRIFEAAGRATGIEVYKDPRRSDAFFAASDNYPLATAGVIAHTVSVVFEDFADYHGAGDEWPKIDFPNMERTVRMVGAAVLMIADAAEEPRWRPGVDAAAPYREAWQRRRGGPRVADDRPIGVTTSILLTESIGNKTRTTDNKTEVVARSVCHQNAPIRNGGQPHACMKERGAERDRLQPGLDLAHEVLLDRGQHGRWSACGPSAASAPGSGNTGPRATRESRRPRGNPRESPAWPPSRPCPSSLGSASAVRPTCARSSGSGEPPSPVTRTPIAWSNVKRNPGSQLRPAETATRTRRPPCSFKPGRADAAARGRRSRLRASTSAERGGRGAGRFARRR